MENTIYKEVYFKNRELSWLQFEERVLEEAMDRTNPLLERVKFLGITASNLDEFFMIRVASLKEMMHAGYEGKDIAGLTPVEQLEMVSKKAHEISDVQDETFKNIICPELLSNGIKIITDYRKASLAEQDAVDRFFEKKLYPVLTPVIVDENRPFPLFKNKSLYIGLKIKKWNKEEEPKLAFIQVPGSLSRLIRLSEEDNNTVLILLEEVIKSNLSKIFKDYEILSVSLFRILRNADISIEDDDASDLLHKIEDKLKLRPWGAAIKLDVFNGIDEELIRILKRELPVTDEDIYEFDVPLDESFMLDIYSIEGYEHLKALAHKPVWPIDLPENENIFEVIKNKDVMLFHPYESFEPLIRLINEAADDDKVLAIKQTLYRVGNDSPVVAALARAAKKGKQVTVLVELKARFDEENNIGFARLLEQAGCNVIYGFPNLKTHCKLLLIVREESDSVTRYVHLSTGNYNNSTAKSYTDIGMLTAKEEYGEDATEIFNMLAGATTDISLKRLSIAPDTLRSKFLYLINREKENALKGRPAKIVAKLNSLCDEEIIERLYDASNANVKIELYVRGICCLKTGIKGVSENITVHSIVGLFLEHSRIYYFENGGEPEYFLASADWMPRNLDRRVEILFPCLDERIKERLADILLRMSLDNTKSRELLPSGEYRVMASADNKRYCFQEDLCTFFGRK